MKGKLVKFNKNYRSEMFVPRGKEGSGHYTRHTQTAGKAVEEATPLILSALQKITDAKKKNLYTICDYGSADGGNSMDLIRKCIGHLKAENPDAEVQVLYEDQPTNDFKSLFYRLHGFIEQPPTYLKDFQGVYVAAIGTGFYEQCAPSNSVDLAICSIAAHWLSKRPCTLKNTLWAVLSEDEEEVNTFKEKAAEDWETFLVHRAAELTPGGQAVFVMPAVDEHGNSGGHTKGVKESVTAVMTDIWKSMTEEGIITETEFANTAFDCWTRTRQELELSFLDEGPVTKAGLKLESLEIKTIPCSLHAQWTENEKKDDILERQNYAAKFVESIRIFSNTTMYAGLSKKRPEDERRRIVDEFYKRYRDIVSSCPNNHAFKLVYAYIHIVKLDK